MRYTRRTRHNNDAMICLFMPTECSSVCARRVSVGLVKCVQISSLRSRWHAALSCRQALGYARSTRHNNDQIIWLCMTSECASVCAHRVKAELKQAARSSLSKISLARCIIMPPGMEMYPEHASQQRSDHMALYDIRVTKCMRPRRT